jgi:LmbE family N-acetylglucosaminyl deacetylase
MTYSMRVSVGFAVALAASFACAPKRLAAQPGTRPPVVPVAPAYNQGAIALAEQVAGIGNTMRVLMIGAHPDDEDTRLLTWLARGRHVETAYLSLTRGDGGQNLIGNELGEALGVIRTEELLAARRIDGAHQYFARAYDFGFSKTAAESFSHWPHDSLLRDVVTVVRAFRPQVIVAVFSGTPRDGHGQHQVSGILAKEAYEVSGDTLAYPVAQFGRPWAALKFYRDRSYFGAGENALSIDVGAYDPLLGVTYAEIAAASRSQHRSQGFGNIIGPAGPMTGYVYREATRLNTPTPAGQEHSIFDGIDTTWARLSPLVHDATARAELDSIAPAIARAQTGFRTADPLGSLSVLSQVARLETTVATRLAVPEEIAELSGEAPVADASASAERSSGPTDQNARLVSGVKVAAPNALDPDLVRTLQVAMARVNRAQVLASGLELHATVAHDVAAVHVPVGAAVALANREPILVLDGQTWATASNSMSGPTAQRPTIAPDSTLRDSVVIRDTVVTQPWWLRTPRRGDMFTQPVSRVAEDQRPGAAMVELALRSQGAASAATFTVPTTVVRRFADPGRGEVDRPLAFVPPVTLTLDRTVEYIPAGMHIDRTLRVWLRSGVDSARTVQVSLQLPKGLTADSASRSTAIDPYGDRHLDFRVRGTLPAGEATLSATAESQGVTYHIGYVPIDYEHIRPQQLYRAAEMHLSVVDVKVPPGLRVAYIPGVGDNVEPMLEQLGLEVTLLDPSALSSTNLSQFGTIVVGPRAFDASSDLRANNGRLLDFARHGGTLVVQYGQYEMADGILPYPITLARPADRVTDENAPVRILDPASPVLNTPNKIGPADYLGWVQERSSYMPHTFDSHYRTVMSMNDPDEPPNDAGLLIAPLGKGTYVYATLAFFRQLPAGVSGPARLFVNLLSLGKRSGPVQ